MIWPSMKTAYKLHFWALVERFYVLSFLIIFEFFPPLSIFLSFFFIFFFYERFPLIMGYCGLRGYYKFSWVPLISLEFHWFLLSSLEFSYDEFPWIPFRTKRNLIPTSAFILRHAEYFTLSSQNSCSLKAICGFLQNHVCLWC